MKRLQVGVALIAAIGMVGCVETSTLVTVNPDGSGTIALREYMSPKMLETMESMTAAMEGMMAGMMEGVSDGMAPGMGAPPPARKDRVPKGPQSGAAAKVDFIGQNIEKSAGEFGQGVTMTKSERRVNDKGWKGFSAEYKFADVTQLRVPKGQKASGPGGGMSMNSSPSTSYRFEFVKGQPSTLKIVPEKMPEMGGAAEADAGGAAQPAAGAGRKMSGLVVSGDGGGGAVKMDPAVEAQMQQEAMAMLKGARMVFFVRVNGTVTETNAKFRSPQIANVFTIFDANLDEMLKDKQVVKLLASGDPSATAKLSATNMPGIRAEDPAKTVTISFR